MTLEVADTIWLTPSTVIAVGSLIVAALGLLASITISICSFRQNSRFKAADILHEEISEIRGNAAEFLSALTEKLVAYSDVKNLNEQIENLRNPLQVGGSQYDEKQVFLSRFSDANSRLREAFIRQGTCYEKMRLLLSNSEQDEALLSRMKKMMKISEFKEIEPDKYSEIVNSILSVKTEEIQERIGTRL